MFSHFPLLLRGFLNHVFVLDPRAHCWLRGCAGETLRTFPSPCPRGCLHGCVAPFGDGECQLQLQKHTVGLQENTEQSTTSMSQQCQAIARRQIGCRIVLAECCVQGAGSNHFIVLSSGGTQQEKCVLFWVLHVQKKARKNKRNGDRFRKHDL